MQHVLQGTEAQNGGMTEKQLRFLSNIERANQIMEGQIDEHGNMRPIEKWPRKARREFTRLTNKSVGR